MGPVSLYVKDPATSRFVSGGLIEAEALLGAPLPTLPPPENEGGRDVFFVNFHPRLKSVVQRFLLGLLAQIGMPASSGVPVSSDSAKDQAEYEGALARILRSVRSTDRRLGLLNLFWLAHSRDVAECLRELENKAPTVRKLKYSLHPLLSSFYRQANHAALRDVQRESPDQAAFLSGGRENPGLVEAIIDDGFAFTELTISDLDFNQFLAWNKRYRLSADLFFEIYQVLLRETERRIREGDRGIISRVSRYMPGFGRDQCLTQSGVLKVMMNSQVMTYLFSDVWSIGAKLTTSPKMIAEGERRRPSEMMDTFLDLVTSVKRFEIIAHLRDRLILLQGFGTEREPDDRVVSKGVRVYEFSESAQVLNNAVNATVFFLDLRGFTETSEGQISERDLTQELYKVFDAIVPHVQRFGGTVDKFLGDGMMVTYGTGHADPLEPLNAVRTAILCQQTMKDLREAGKTYFKMGISIHYGRVYVAHFIADEDTVQTTVIGRNVNLAGRLSSGAKQPMDEDEAEMPVPESSRRASGLLVTVDQAGNLFNEGIAISRDTLVQLETHLALVQTQEAGTSILEYFDERIGRRILIRYAGDAKFKGVRSSFPVYEVDYEA
jgi:class 3 adenylate cyclase